MFAFVLTSSDPAGLVPLGWGCDWERELGNPE